MSINDREINSTLSMNEQNLNVFLIAFDNYLRLSPLNNTLLKKTSFGNFVLILMFADANTLPSKTTKTTWPTSSPSCSTFQYYSGGYWWSFRGQCKVVLSSCQGLWRNLIFHYNRNGFATRTIMECTLGAYFQCHTMWWWSFYGQGKSWLSS